MARTEWLTVGLCLLATVLFDASSQRMACAEEAPAKSDHQTTPDSKGQSAAEPKGGAGDHATGDGGAGAHQTSPTSSPTGQESTGRESDPVDTRISAEPHRSTSRQVGAKAPTTRLKSFSHSNGRPPRWSHPSSGLVRNAIGVAVTPRQPGPHENHAVPLAAHSPAGPTGVGIGASPGIGKATAAPDANKLLHPPPMPGPPAASVRQGTINGTGLSNRGSGPPQIGGPAKTLAGINGTTIKPKR